MTTFPLNGIVLNISTYIILISFGISYLYSLMALLFENRIKGDKQAFIKKLNEISQKLDVDPNWLMAVFNAESGVNPQARNTTHLVAGKPATGLIQWTEPTAKSVLGMSVDQIYKMNGVQQLDLVEKYFRPAKYRITKYTDLYRYTFFPVALGKPNDYVFETSKISADSVARSNPVIDLNKNLIITNKEFDEYALNKVPEPYRSQFRSQSTDSIQKKLMRNRIEIGIGFLLIALALGGLYYFFARRKNR